MRVMYCWRRRMEAPMLDEEELAASADLYSGGMRGAKEFREAHGIPLVGASGDEWFEPVRDAYKEMTGTDESKENAITDHRIALNGPDSANARLAVRSGNELLSRAAESNSGMHPTRLNVPFIIAEACGRVMPGVRCFHLR